MDPKSRPIMVHLDFLKTQPVVLLIFIYCLGICSCNHGNPMQKTIIIGEVTNFEEPYDLPVIELFNSMPFIFKSNTLSCFIEQDGAFRFEIDQLYPYEIWFRFKEMFTVYASPGDSINLIIDARMLADTSNTLGFENKYIQIQCPNQRFQDEYQDFTLAFRRSFQTHDDFIALEETQKNLDPTEYLEYVKEQSLKYNAFLNEYFKQNRSGREFHEWSNNWLYAYEIYDLLRYTWRHPSLNEMDQNTYLAPEEYYNFLKDEKHNDEKMMVSQYYQLFLHYLYMHLYRKFHQSELHSQFITLYEASNKTEAYRIYLKYIIANSSGFEQEYLVSKVFSNLINWKFSDAYDALYEPSLVGRDDYNQVLAKEYAELQKLITKPVYAKDVNLHDSSILENDLVFQTLPGKYPDKVIYVDFWAPWCGPCLAEMPLSKKIQEKLSGKEVVFVFLASKCTEKSWKATIAERQLSGEHYLLKDSEYSMLADKFDIAGIPRYMIIDKKGQVVNDDAARPSDENLVGLLETLSEK